eukprot:TRINITY_DN34061_c0_g1_i1.p1 TRINITY_DN34061_c0_g1~~TRINITY_DN34061_c0_g1_i1.p1  ORF type:complete len:296 (+),score=56.01 TRINITY_DN34061_c0_g1_i1:239-1126(+)
MRVRLREDHQRVQIQQAEKVWQEEREALEEEIAERDAQLLEKDAAARKLDSKIVHLQTTITSLHDEINTWRERLKIKDEQMELQKKKAAEDLAAAKDEVKFVDDLRAQLALKEEEIKEVTAAYRKYLHKDVHRADWQAEDMLQHFSDHKTDLEKLVNQFADETRQKVEKIGTGTVAATSGTGMSSEEFMEVKQLLSEIRGMQQYLYTLQQSGMPASLVGFTELATMGYSMHSNFPPQLKNHLYAMDKEQLLVVLDSLSFLDGVVEYIAKDLTPRYMVQLKANSAEPMLVHRPGPG